MVTMIGYGPEANFAEEPKAPEMDHAGALQEDRLADAGHGPDDGRGR